MRGDRRKPVEARRGGSGRPGRGSGRSSRTPRPTRPTPPTSRRSRSSACASRPGRAGRRDHHPVVLLDHGHDFLPRDAVGGRDPSDMRALAIERFVLFGVVPLLTILAPLPRRPAPLRAPARRVAARPRAGARRFGRHDPGHPLVARVPEFQAFYSQSAGSLPGMVFDQPARPGVGRVPLPWLPDVQPAPGRRADRRPDRDVPVRDDPSRQARGGDALDARRRACLRLARLADRSIVWSALFHVWILTLVVARPPRRADLRPGRRRSAPALELPVEVEREDRALVLVLAPRLARAPAT